MIRFIAVTIILLIAEPTLALDIVCEDRELADYKELADMIFIGNVADDHTEIQGEGYFLVNVHRKWKGPDQGSIKLFSNTRWPLTLSENDYYIFYLKSAEENGSYWVHPCNSRILEVAFGGEDLAFLGEPTWSSGSE